MISPLLRRVSTAAFLLAAAIAVRAEPAIISKARAYVGPEAALDAIRSVHYVGSLVTPDPTDEKKMTYVSVEIIAVKPFRQRMTFSSDRSIEITGLDGYDAWHRVQNPKDPTKGSLQLLGRPQIKRLRANTWENLSFYRGLEHEGGKIVDLGAAEADGVSCRKIAFVHSDTYVFVRYFDDATGRLVRTETEGNVVIREQGEIRVNGVRFPKSIATTSKDAKGKERTVVLTFDKVTVNESFPDNLFTIPPVSRL
jgi:hypothetical protein